MSFLVITEREIRRHGPGNVLGVCWRQWWGERRLKRRGVRFRDTNVEAVAEAYRAMTPEEFAAINGRQDWANWRTIPRALSGHVADRPLRILDLGSGIGSSTRVLAFYAPPGSHITGYELAEPLVEVARDNSYCGRDGSVVRVDFVCQAVTTKLLQAGGSPVPERSVDVVNASGVVGHHLDGTAARTLAAELCRILAPAGIAMLDIGPVLPAGRLREIMEGAGFAFLGRYRSGWWDPTGEVVFRWKPSGQP